MSKRDYLLPRLPALGKTIFLFFLSSFLITILFSSQAKDSAAVKKIKVVTSVFPLYEFAKVVSGERGEVSLLIPPGAETHTWQPRPSDIIRLSSADLFVYIGADLEPWLEDLLKSVKNPDLGIIDASQGITLIDEKGVVLKEHKNEVEGIVHEGHEQEAEEIVHIDKESEKEGTAQVEHEHEHGAADPHIWLDFRNDQIIVDKITAALSEMDPEGSAVFKKNASVYKEKLEILDQKFKEGLKDCGHRTIILGGHAAFGYLARRYSLRQVSIYGLSPDSRPTPKKLVEVVELAKKHRIEVIFFEVYVRDELAKVLADEVGASTLVLNPGANLTKEQLKSGKTFFDIMEENLENLRNGLNCK